MQDNAREHIFDGIVIDTPDGRRFVDAPEVARIFERAVVLTITADEARDAARAGLRRWPSGCATRRPCGARSGSAARCATAGTGAEWAWIEPVTLTGAHVVLEPAADRHLADLLAAGQDDLVWAWLPWPRPATEADVAAMLDGERQVAFPFAQVDAASGRAVGVTTYRDVDERHRTLEIGGTWIGRPWWRTAINTEAKLLFLGHAFETLGANRVAIKTDIRNERSQAAIARLGAVREGVLRHQYVRRDGSLRDTVMYSIVPDEWPAVKQLLQARLAANAMNVAAARDRARQGHAAGRDGRRSSSTRTARRGDRAFCVVDAETRLLLTTRTPRLLQVVPRWDGTTLTLRFPDGSEVVGGAGARRARDDAQLRRPRRSAGGSSAARSRTRSPSTSGRDVPPARARRGRAAAPTTRRSR